MTNYEKQAQDFLDKTNSTIEIKFLKNDFHFADDKEKRDIYKITIKRGARKYSFNFGNSINDSREWLFRTELNSNRVIKLPLSNFTMHLINPANDSAIYEDLARTQENLYGDTPEFSDKIVRKKAPSIYSVLACLDAYEYEDFEDFCESLGYDSDSIKANKIFKAAQDQAANIKMLWNDQEIEDLREIQ